MARIEDVRGRIPPEVEERIDRAVTQFRDAHRHPANLALHAGAAYLILKGVVRILRGRVFRGATLIAVGIGLVLAGHEVEKGEGFAAFRSNGSA